MVINRYNSALSQVIMAKSTLVYLPILNYYFNQSMFLCSEIAEITRYIYLHRKNDASLFFYHYKFIFTALNNDVIIFNYFTLHFKGICVGLCLWYMMYS